MVFFQIGIDMDIDASIGVYKENLFFQNLKKS